MKSTTSSCPYWGGVVRLIDWIYPVGAVLASVNPDYDPNNIFRTHTWERFAKGQTLVGVNESDTAFSTAGKTGGEKTHKLTEAEMPSHAGHLNTNSGMNYIGNTASYMPSTVLKAYGSSGRGWNSVNGGEIQPAGVSRGSGSAHNNLQPYTTVYYWKRTA